MCGDFEDAFLAGLSSPATMLPPPSVTSAEVSVHLHELRLLAFVVSWHCTACSGCSLTEALAAARA